MIRAAFIVLLACLATGCAGSLEAAKREQKLGGMQPPTPERCASLDGQRRSWGAVAKASAVLAGGAGVSTIPATEEKLETGLAIGSVVVGAISAAAVYVSEDAGETWVREGCAAQ